MTIEAGRTSPRRPRNRKAQLTEAAAELFRRHGYHGVSVNDIAAAAGVTGPAVYRHFRGKQDILAQVLLCGLDRLGAVTDEVLDGSAGPAGLPGLTGAVAALAVERRDVTALWRWQGRYLDREEQSRIRHRGVEIMSRWVHALRRVRQELSEEDASLLCWAALSVFGSVADHHVSLPRRRFERLLAGLADAVLGAQVLPAAEPLGPASANGAAWQRRDPLPVSRREELLSAATALFRERGYHAVSMEDIGAKAGIAGPSVYRHFAGKAEILVAAGYRMADRLGTGADRAVADATGPDAALTGIVRSYVDIVLRSDNLISVYADQVIDVPDRDRKELTRLQRSYVARWVRLLREVSPALPEPDARIAVHAALTIVNDLTRTPRAAARPGIGAELTGLANTVLANAAHDK